MNLEKMGIEVPAAPLPAPVAHWLAAERDVMAVAW